MADWFRSKEIRQTDKQDVVQAGRQVRRKINKEESKDAGGRKTSVGEATQKQAGRHSNLAGKQTWWVVV